MFSSQASNLVAGDTNGEYDIFVKDTLTGTTTRVSTSSSGSEALNNGAYFGAISADGRYVAFNSRADNLVAGDTNGEKDAFIKDTLTGITTRVSTDSAGGQGNSASHVTAISADGRYVAFNSRANNLVAGDTNGEEDAFIKDTLTGVTTRISTDSAGNQGGSGNGYGSYARAISADGRFVAFYSDEQLVQDDTNSWWDAFLKNLTKTGVQQLSGLIVSNPVSAGVSLMLTARARTELTAYRSALGTALNRIDSFTNTLSAATISMKEAAGRVQDADIAEETSKLIAARVRQEVTAGLIKKLNLDAAFALRLLTG
jgi:flagellin-like hook-associated protein FlgL